MKLFSDASKILAAATLGLSIVSFGMVATADAAMMKKMDHKMEMKCKAMHGMMMHGKCAMMKKK